MFNPLSRREVLRFGAFTTVGGVLTPGISLAQAIVTDTKGIVARDVQLTVGGTSIPAYDARPEKAGRYPIVVVISGFTGNSEQNKDVVRGGSPRPASTRSRPSSITARAACRARTSRRWGRSRARSPGPSTSGISAPPPTTPSSSRGRRRTDWG